MSTPPPTQEPDDGSGDRPRERRRDRSARGGAGAERPSSPSDADSEARTAASDAETGDRTAAADARPELAEVARLRERVSELEAALERKDEELDAVRRQYEALLQGRDGTDSAVTWRTGGECWEGDVELEYANRADRGEAATGAVAEGAGESRDGGRVGRLRSLLR